LLRGGAAVVAQLKEGRLLGLLIGLGLIAPQAQDVLPRVALAVELYAGARCYSGSW